VSGVKSPAIARASLLALAAHLGCAHVVRAQAWVPSQGEGTVSLTYQDYDVVGHFDAFGRKNTNGGTHTHAVVAEIDYGVTDTIGLTVTLPFIASKYTGPPSYFVGTHETHPGPLDDGAYHAAVQDIRIEARRLFWVGPAAVAPLVGFSFPTHDYETVGEAVPGRHRRDLQLGASAGIDLDRLVRRAYVQVRYAYGIAERIHDIPFTRSNIDVEVGQAPTSRLALRALVNSQVRHEGPSLDELSDDWENHDRFIAPSFLNLGGGASFSLTRSADVYALWLFTVSGSNGAHRGRLIAAGTTWEFGRGLSGMVGPGKRHPS
jgi:hypothetical protein